MPNILDEKITAKNPNKTKIIILITLLVFVEFGLNISGYLYYFYEFEYEDFIGNLGSSNIHAIAASQVVYLFLTVGGVFWLNFFFHTYLIDNQSMDKPPKDDDSGAFFVILYSGFISLFFPLAFIWGFIYSYGMMDRLSIFSDIEKLEILMNAFIIQISVIYAIYFILLQLALKNGLLRSK